MKSFPVAPAIALLIGLFTACSQSPKTANKPATTTKADAKLLAISNDNAAFFKHGPQVGRDPDQKLAKDTLVRLIRPSFGGFSKVELAASHEQGYVASEDLGPATSALLAAASAPKVDLVVTPPSVQEPNVEQFNLNSSDPRLVPPPEDLPPTELPLPSPGQ